MDTGRGGQSTDREWLDRTVLITGATGFLGGHLTRALVDRGAEVVIISRDFTGAAQRALLSQQVTSVIGDVGDLDLLERTLSDYDVRTVFHLAAQTQVGAAAKSPTAAFEANIKGTWNLLEACRRAGGVEVVLASSDKVYGDHGGREYTEDLPLLANYPYDASKACADRLAHTYQHTYGLRVAIARCGNLFGPGDLNWNRIVPAICRAYARGVRPVLRSDGKGHREYLFVDDAVDAYLLLGDPSADVTGPFNFGSGFVVSPLDLIERIGTIAGRSDLTPVIESRELHEVPTQRLSSAKARKLLDWSPRAEHDTALRSTYDWYHSLVAPG